MKFNEMLEGVFNEGTEEYEIIKEAYELVVNSAPTISAEMKTHMILLDHSKTKLATLHYLLGRNIAQLRETIQTTYDSQYTRLVKLGRPSKDAIESEIRATNPEYSGIAKKISSLQEVRDLVGMYIRCLDSSKQTTMEALRDSRRID